MNKFRARSLRRAESRDTAREHSHTFLTHGHGPRLNRRAVGLTNKNRPAFLMDTYGEVHDGKHVVTMTPSVRAIKRVSGGGVRV